MATCNLYVLLTLSILGLRYGIAQVLGNMAHLSLMLDMLDQDLASDQTLLVSYQLTN